jgi:hypothetical protein
VVSGLVGYLMSLPSVREELGLDDTSSQASWSAKMKDKVLNLAREGYGLPIAYNGAAKLLASNCNKPATKKRDNIQGDPFSQTVCIQTPPQRLEECQLTIILAPRCLYVTGINVVTGRLFLNQHCHVTIFSFLEFILIEYCRIKIIIFNFDTESSCSWNKRGMFFELFF